MDYNIADSGNRIRELRTSRNMTRQQLAERTGLSVNALSKIETGINGAKIDTLISIAELFHVSLDYLVCGRGNEEDPVLEGLLKGLSKGEREYICKMIQSAIENITLLKE